MKLINQQGLFISTLQIYKYKIALSVETQPQETMEEQFTF